MGLILDSSVLIQAERKSETVAQLLKQVVNLTGNQETALSAIALVELAHGIHRPNTVTVRKRRELFVQELLADVPVYPFTQQIALLAGQVDAEQQKQGTKIPFQDLLIGATALHLGYAIVTGNPRHFQMIPKLSVKML
ncbi:MAG TPA: PIN domain-containing protein [Bryobacteraceae bacterium]|nr:PIN domain-containing protein [Bryobacteraceae bacterium]